MNFIIYQTFICLKDRVTERVRGRELWSAGLFPKCLQQPGLGQAEARSQEFHLGLSGGWQEPNHWGHPLMFSQVLQLGAGSEMQQPMWGAFLVGGDLTCATMLVLHELFEVPLYYKRLIPHFSFIAVTLQGDHVLSSYTLSFPWYSMYKAVLQGCDFIGFMWVMCLARD